MNTTKKISPLVVLFYIIALVFFLYGIYMIYYSITDIISYHTYEAVSTSSIIQHVVSSCALYLGFSIVIFAAAKIMKAFSTLKITEQTDAIEAVNNEAAVQDTESELQTISDPEPAHESKDEPAKETASEPITAPVKEAASEAQAIPEPKEEPAPNAAPTPETEAEPKEEPETKAATASETAPEPPVVERVKLSADRINNIVNKGDNTNRSAVKINNNY